MFHRCVVGYVDFSTSSKADIGTRKKSFFFSKVRRNHETSSLNELLFVDLEIAFGSQNLSGNVVLLLFIFQKG